MVKELLLGDNPFIGVSHLAREKALEEQSECSLENKISVIEAAVKGGATGFTFSTHPSNLELLKYMRENRADLAERLNYYLLVPYAAKYVREATSIGTPKLVKKVLIGNLNLIKGLKYVLWPKPANFIKLFLEVELKEYLAILPNIKAILLHEILTEQIIAFNLGYIVQDLAKHFSKRGLGFGLETRNAKHTKFFLERNGIKIDYLMTPLNPLGYQMTPTKEEAEKSIIELSSRGVKIIGINVLSSGAIEVKEALDYLLIHRDHIFAVAIGTSKNWRALETFKLLTSRLRH